MKRVHFFVISICLLISANALGQLSLKGDFRPRGEYRHGYKSLLGKDTDAAMFISQRSRLNLGYKAEKYTIGLSFQDIRTWGSTSQLNTSDPYSSIHEAWGQVQLGNSLALKVGRQEVAYDDHRIFGTVGWAQQGRSHDLALLKYETESGMKLHFGFGFNQDSEKLSTTTYTTGGNYKSLQYLWYHNKIGNGKLSVLFLNNGLQYIDPANADDNETRFSQTLGGRYVTKISAIDVSSNIYYQFGNSIAEQNVSAYLLNLDLGYALADGKSKLGLGFEALSGTDEVDQGNADKDMKSFTPFYGTNHKFNGHMDYFYVGNHMGNVGLLDIYASFKTKFGAYAFKSTLHSFHTMADVQDPNNANNTMSNGLGTEIDLSIGRKIVDGVSVNLGYSHMFGTKTMETIKGGDKKETTNWAWIMIRFTPDFLK